MADAMGILDVAFVGAGAIHFGGAEGPWNHSSRLENIPNIRFRAIVDVDLPRAESVLKEKLRGDHGTQYKHCKVYRSVEELLDSEEPLHAVFVGTPPLFRGSPEKGKDMELVIVSRGLNLFVEKPMSVIAPGDFAKYATSLEEKRKQTNSILSVGYMFRYHAGVLKMNELIRSHGGKVMVFNARYYTAYSEMNHPFWWDINKSGGPVVEQATHFCDLARFLVGDVNLETVTTTCLREGDPGGAGRLSHVLDICERDIPVEKRIPRVTMSTWRFVGGGLGTMTHAVALHGKQYETCVEILMDGLRLTLYEPYTEKCKLLVRDGRSQSDDEVVYHFGEDDPYKTELETFIEAIRMQDGGTVASSYSDAAKTYEFSWAVRLAGEK